MRRAFSIVYSGDGVVRFTAPGQGGGDELVISEEFFGSFLQDGGYLGRFSFLGEGECRLEGSSREKAEGLFRELIELKSNPLNTSADLIKVLLLQLFIVIERSKLRPRTH